MTPAAPASLVLVHGAGSGPWVYDGWAERFSGVEAIPVDLQAGLDVARASHDDYAARIVEAARSAEPPVALCGWSMGGLAVLQAAARLGPHPGMGPGSDRAVRLAGLVLLEASAPAEVQGTFPDTPVEDGAFDPEEVYGAFPPGMPSRRESSRARAERKRGISVPRTPCRTLVVHGDDFPVERGSALAALYGADLLAFPGLDHWGLVRDARVAEAAAGWLGVARPGVARPPSSSPPRGGP